MALSFLHLSLTVRSPNSCPPLPLYVATHSSLMILLISSIFREWKRTTALQELHSGTQKKFKRQ